MYLKLEFDFKLLIYTLMHTYIYLYNIILKISIKIYFFKNIFLFFLLLFN